MAEFAENNHESAATKTIPFFANYGFHPRFDNSLPPKDNSSESLDAQQFTKDTMELQDFLRNQIRTAQDGYEETTNLHRTPAPVFQVGDKVFISTKNIRTARTLHKLDWKRIETFPIKTVLSADAYELT